MGIEFGKGNKEYRQKIDKAMSLIRAWVNPDELNYREETGCLSFVIRGRKGIPTHVSIFNIENIGTVDHEMMALHTTRGSTIYIQSSGKVSLMIS